MQNKASEHELTNTSVALEDVQDQFGGKDTKVDLRSADLSKHDSPCKNQHREQRQKAEKTSNGKKKSYVKPKRSKSVEDRRLVKQSLKASIGVDSLQMSNDDLALVFKDCASEKAENSQSFKVARAHMRAGGFSPYPSKKKSAENDNKMTKKSKKKEEAKTDRRIYDCSEDEEDFIETKNGLLDDSPPPISPWGKHGTGGRELSMDLASLSELGGVDTEYEDLKSPVSAERPILRSLMKHSNETKRSMRNLGRESIRDIRESLMKKQHMVKRGVRFEEHVDFKDISRLGKSAIDDLFYNSADLADFRQEAFLEECGLDPAEYM